MKDEAYEIFVEEFGEPFFSIAVPKHAIETWRGKLPDRLLAHWQEAGWGGYAKGLLWIVDPEEYEDLVDEWLDNCPLEQIDAFHVVARTAFGELFLCGERTGASATINCATNAIFALAQDLRTKTARDLDISIRTLLTLERDDCELADESGHPLFDRALMALGPLAPDEMYGFEPALVAGGKRRLENLRKVKLDQHLTILRQLAVPTMPFSSIDINRLLKP